MPPEDMRRPHVAIASDVTGVSSEIRSGRHGRTHRDLPTLRRPQSPLALTRMTGIGRTIFPRLQCDALRYAPLVLSTILKATTTGRPATGFAGLIAKRAGTSETTRRPPYSTTTTPSAASRRQPSAALANNATTPRPARPTAIKHVAFPPKCDDCALRHEQSELLLAAAGALRSPLAGGSAGTGDLSDARSLGR
jgi:hypothetical protein